jgi:hypothetical protein
VLHQGLICFVFVHGIFAYHDVDPSLDFVHKVLGALALAEFNPELREGNLPICPVDIVVHEFGRGPTVRDRPDARSDKFFDNITTAEYCAGQMKSTLAIPDSQGPLVVLPYVHRGEGRDRAGKLRHIDFQVKPVRLPIIGKVGLAARRNLNSGNPLSGVLASRIEGTACMLAVVELPIFTFNNFWNNYQFVKSGEGIDDRAAAEGLQNPYKLRDFEK